MAKRRRFTGEFKAKVALEALRGERPIQDIAAKYGVHPNQVSTWKKRDRPVKPLWRMVGPVSYAADAA